MLEHSFPRDPLQQTDTDRARIDQDGQTKQQPSVMKMKPMLKSKTTAMLKVST